MIYGGIDVAKHSHEVCLVNDAGDIVLKMHLDNNHKGMNKFLQALERLGLKPDGVKFCLEATGHYWLPIYCYLTKLGFELHVINPIQSDALRNLYVRKTKTDQKDALLLADLLRLGRAPETRLPSETTLKLQSLSRLRFEFVRQVGGLKNRVLGILD
ncbi:IS110 family transposase, partial [Thermosediminibacter litoriperuensis]|uniref:IS110 family transposase n=1 Tax=Thermosediminibacter litoriperuensis TaxID=291989 RepID=UPI0011E72461